MDYNKLSETGRKIKLSDEKKREIIDVCKENCGHKTFFVPPGFRKISAVLCVLIIFTAIGFAYKNRVVGDISAQSNIIQNDPTKGETDILNTVVSSDINIYQPTDDVGGGDLGLLKYRMNYYDIPAPFAEIVEADIFENWYSEVLTENPNETNVMIMKRFINHFDVSREDFEKANLEWAKIIAEEMDGTPAMDPKDYANQELEEIYNVDILYTLDDEIINNYYLSHEYPYVYSYDFMKAIESGEYVSQTKDWIDIEQMEAEIIAKYGETEIVPKTTAMPEEITTTDLSLSETTE